MLIISQYWMRVALTLIGALFSANRLCADNGTTLYAVAGTPVDESGRKFPAALYVVNDHDLNLNKVREIVSREQGVGFVLANQELRTIVVGSPPMLSTHYEILHMDSPHDSQSFDLAKKGLVSIARYLLALPSGSTVLGIEFGNYGKKPYQLDLVGVNLSTLEQSTLPWEDYVYASLVGMGGWSPPNSDFLWVFPFEDGRLTFRYGMKVTKTPWVLPKQVQFPPDYNLGAVVNNLELLIVGGGKQQEFYKTTDLRILDKAGNKWHAESFPGSSTELRGFGHWVAFVVRK
ncbi:MAG: hypothetical protein ABJF23_24305 [Bryobacteraceae bacterium]